MNDKIQRNIFQYLTIAVVVLIVIGGMALVYPTYLRCQELERRENELSGIIEKKKAEIARLRDYQRRFREDPDFVEKIARQNRRVFPGEYVFIFDD